MSNPISDRKAMIAQMNPALDPVEYCFCLIKAKQLDAIASDDVLATFREDEGLTAVLPIEHAASIGQSGSPYRRIVLQVHSALDGVGLTAAVSGALADAGVACNIIAAYYHDHIFVPVDAADRALEILKRLSTDV